MTSGVFRFHSTLDTVMRQQLQLRAGVFRAVPGQEQLLDAGMGMLPSIHSQVAQTHALLRASNASRLIAEVSPVRTGLVHG